MELLTTTNAVVVRDSLNSRKKLHDDFTNFSFSQFAAPFAYNLLLHNSVFVPPQLCSHRSARFRDSCFGVGI